MINHNFSTSHPNCYLIWAGTGICHALSSIMAHFRKKTTTSKNRRMEMLVKAIFLISYPRWHTPIWMKFEFFALTLCLGVLGCEELIKINQASFDISVVQIQVYWDGRYLIWFLRWRAILKNLNFDHFAIKQNWIDVWIPCSYPKTREYSMKAKDSKNSYFLKIGLSPSFAGLFRSFKSILE